MQNERKRTRIIRGHSERGRRASHAYHHSSFAIDLTKKRTRAIDAVFSRWHSFVFCLFMRLLPQRSHQSQSEIKQVVNLDCGSRCADKSHVVRAVLSRYDSDFNLDVALICCGLKSHSGYNGAKSSHGVVGFRGLALMFDVKEIP